MSRAMMKENRKDFPTRKTGTIVNICLPRPVSKLVSQEARLAGTSKESYLGQLVIHRHSSVRLDKNISARVKAFADRLGETHEAAVHKLLNIALGYVE